MMATRQTSAWRYMPAAIGGWLAVVALVNGTMVYDALHSFPGEAGGNAFDISNHYNALLDASEREARLGWTVVVTVDRGVAAVRLAAKHGAPLAGASIRGAAVRPVGPNLRTPLVFHPAPGGIFLAGASLPATGQWDISLVVSAAGHDLHVTRRVTAQ